MTRRADILMVTHRSAGYLDLSLPRLLETCGEDDRVWLWHNGDDEETLEKVRKYAEDPRVHAFHHSRENVRLHAPLSWLWTTSDARFVSKVDDDCRVTPGWIDTFAAAHGANPQFGAVASWRHYDEDFIPELAARKIVTYNDGHQLLRNAWVQGSGVLVSRRWVDRCGSFRPKESFNAYCVRLARGGAVNGWYFPFVHEDHMDDPRSPYTLMTDDEAFRDRSPLTAQQRGVTTVAQWEAQLRNDARVLQSADPDPRKHSGWRAKLHNVRQRLLQLQGRWPTRQRMRAGEAVFISWIDFHGRSAGLAEQLDATAYFLHGRRRTLPVPVRHLVNAVDTAVLLVRARPRSVTVMLPPLPLLVVARAWTLLTGAPLVGDMHSGVFNDERWTWATRITLRLLRRGLAVVTNEPLAEVCRDAGVPVLILHDSLEDRPAAPPPPEDRLPVVLAPLSYAADEPVTEVLRAAARRDDVTWVLTGRAPAAVKRKAPPNVTFCGHVPKDEYDQLLETCNVVLALTTREHTLQRAGYEAANASKPLVTSSTAALQEFFADGAVYADPTGDSIAAAVTEALERGPALSERMREVQATRRQEQGAALAVLRERIGTGSA